MPSKIEKEILHLAETLFDMKEQKQRHKQKIKQREQDEQDINTNHEQREKQEKDNLTETQKFLLQSLENENNHEIQKLSFEELQTRKEYILTHLQLDKTLIKRFLKTLKEYRYVDELTDIREGCYTRWIHLQKDEITLTKGGILCEIKVTNDNVMLVFKNNMNRFFQCNMAHVLLFQKLTDQEQIILFAMQVLQNNETST